MQPGNLFLTKIFCLTISRIGLHFFYDYNHFFDTQDIFECVSSESHLNILIKMILKTYLKIRINHMCNLKNEKEKGELIYRQILTKIFF